MVCKDAMVHDSYFCLKYTESMIKAFPTKRKNEIANFVGSVIQTKTGLNFTKQNQCPKECRPKEHKDWIYC